jgi:hypothetical protein
MCDKMSEIRYKPKMNNLDMELMAIKEEQMLKRFNMKDKVVINFNNKLCISLNKFITKITKAS